MSILLKDANTTAYHYQMAVQEKLSSICEPIFNLGIKYFCYFRMFEDGRYFHFLNNTALLKSYFETIRNNGTTFTERMNKVSKNGSLYFTLSSSAQVFDRKDDPIILMLHDFNIWNIFYIFKDGGENSLECYAFAGTRDQVKLLNLYLNHLDLLESFCDYFKEKAADLIDCQDKRKLGFFDQQFHFYQESQEDALLKEVEVLLKKAIEKKRILKTSHQNVPLTRREVDCLNYLSIGKSMKEIARTLGLSPRTVEYYIQNLKQKSGLSRSELITQFVTSWTRDRTLPWSEKNTFPAKKRGFK